MKRLTVSLPEGELERLQLWARQKKTPVSKLVREILVEAIADADWRAQHQALHEELGPRARAGTWNREEIYAERLGRIP